MSKGALGDAPIPSRFWPWNVPDVVGTPRLHLYRALLGRWAEDKPNKTAVVSGGSSRSFAELDRETAAVSRCLPPQAKEGALVAIAMDFSLDFFRAFFGCIRAGCGALLLNPSASQFDTAFVLRDSMPAAIVAGDDTLATIGDSEFGDVAKVSTSELTEWVAKGDASGEGEGHQARAEMESTAVVFYTRTAMARPLEAVYHSHASVLSGLVSFSTFMGLDEKDTYLCFLPPWDWAGFYGAMSVLCVGGAAVIPDSEQRHDIIGQSLKYGGTFSLVRPESLVEKAGKRTGRPFGHFRRARDEFPLRWLGVPVASVDKNLSRVQRAFERANGVPTLLQYGSCEVGPCISNHWSWNVHGALGIPITNVRLRLEDAKNGEPLSEPWELAGPGRLALGGPTLMKGYETPDSNAALLRDDWLYTGKMVEMDPNGVIHLLGEIPGRHGESG